MPDQILNDKNVCAFASPFAHTDIKFEITDLNTGAFSEQHEFHTDGHTPYWSTHQMRNDCFNFVTKAMRFQTIRHQRMLCGRVLIHESVKSRWLRHNSVLSLSVHIEPGCVNETPWHTKKTKLKENLKHVRWRLTTSVSVSSVLTIEASPGTSEVAIRSNYKQLVPSSGTRRPTTTILSRQSR